MGVASEKGSSPPNFELADFSIMEAGTKSMFNTSNGSSASSSNTTVMNGSASRGGSGKKRGGSGKKRSSFSKRRLL